MDEEINAFDYNQKPDQEDATLEKFDEDELAQCLGSDMEISEEEDIISDSEHPNQVFAPAPKPPKISIFNDVQQEDHIQPDNSYMVNPNEVVDQKP